MKKNRIEIVNLTIALLALLVAIVSIWFSYYSYKDTKTERLNIQAGFVANNYQTKIIPIGQNAVVPIYWELIVTNNSEKTLSITDVNVENIKNENGTIMYSHIYDGLFENFENYDNGQIDLPININSGESRKLYIRIGIMCDSLASSILLKQDFISIDSKQKDSWIRFNKAKIKLGEKGIDFYGNKSSIEYENEKIILYQSDAKKQQEFRITLTSGKNNSTSKIVKLYMPKE